MKALNAEFKGGKRDLAYGNDSCESAVTYSNLTFTTEEVKVLNKSEERKEGRKVLSIWKEYL